MHAATYYKQCVMQWCPCHVRSSHLPFLGWTTSPAHAYKKEHATALLGVVAYAPLCGFDFMREKGSKNRVIENLKADMDNTYGKAPISKDLGA